MAKQASLDPQMVRIKELHMSMYNPRSFSVFESYLPAADFYDIIAPNFLMLISFAKAAGLTGRAVNNLDALQGRQANRHHMIETIERLERERAAKFFAPENLERVGRRAGKPDFVRRMTHMIENPYAYAGHEGERKKLRMLQFISDAYNEHIGAPRTTVKLYDGPRHSAGYFNRKNSIYVNRNHPAFKNDFIDLINTVVHENTHNGQANPNVYSDPRLSRIYRDNFVNYKNAQMHGYGAYRWQPIEAGAFAAGDVATRMLNHLVSANDNAFRPGARRAIRQFYHPAA